MAAETKRCIVIAAYWAEGEPDELVARAKDALDGEKAFDSAGGVVAFRESSVDARFRAHLSTLDLAEVAHSSPSSSSTEATN